MDVSKEILEELKRIRVEIVNLTDAIKNIPSKINIHQTIQKKWSPEEVARYEDICERKRNKKKGLFDYSNLMKRD